jgi:PASTA domain-containing protein
MGGARPEAGSIAWTITRRIGMVLILALAFFLSAVVTIYTLFRSGDTRVPNLIGKPEAEAQRMAEEAGLKVRIVRRADERAPADTVIETRPGPNSSVKTDSGLTIVISTGPPQIKTSVSGFWFPVSGYYRAFDLCEELETRKKKPETKNQKLETFRGDI